MFKQNHNFFQINDGSDSEGEISESNLNDDLEPYLIDYGLAHSFLKRKDHPEKVKECHNI